MKLNIAAIQMVSGDDVAANLRETGDLIARAVDEGAGLIALPEYFALIASDASAKLKIRETEGDGPLQDFMRSVSRRHGVWLVGGTIPLCAEDAKKARSATLVYDPQGNCVARYDKRHLFRFSQGMEHYDESATIEAGKKSVSFDVPFGRVGLGICFDLRYPEFFRAMAPVDLIVLPAAFTYTTGQAHWEILLRARAIENQCYVLAPGQGGIHAGGRRTWGHSLIIDPWGKILACREGGAGVVVAEFDSARIAEVRTLLPDVMPWQKD